MTERVYEQGCFLFDWLELCESLSESTKNPKKKTHEEVRLVFEHNVVLQYGINVLCWRLTHPYPLFWSLWSCHFQNIILKPKNSILKDKKYISKISLFYRINALQKKKSVTELVVVFDWKSSDRTYRSATGCLSQKNTYFLVLWVPVPHNNVVVVHMEYVVHSAFVVYSTWYFVTISCRVHHSWPGSSFCVRTTYTKIYYDKLFFDLVDLTCIGKKQSTTITTAHSSKPLWSNESFNIFCFLWPLLTDLGEVSCFISEIIFIWIFGMRNYKPKWTKKIV